MKYFLFDFFFFLRVVFDFIGLLFRWFLRGFQRLMNFFAFLFFFFCVNRIKPAYIRFGRHRLITEIINLLCLSVGFV